MADVKEQQVDAPKGGSKNTKQGKKFFVCIEDQEFPWPRSEITTEEIIELGGWEPSKGAILVDKDQNERTLEPGEIIALKPGHRFGKKFQFKRG